MAQNIHFAPTLTCAHRSHSTKCLSSKPSYAMDWSVESKCFFLENVQSKADQTTPFLLIQKGCLNMKQASGGRQWNVKQPSVWGQLGQNSAVHLSWECAEGHEGEHAHMIILPPTQSEVAHSLYFHASFFVCSCSSLFPGIILSVHYFSCDANAHLYSATFTPYFEKKRKEEPTVLLTSLITF